MFRKPASEEGTLCVLFVFAAKRGLQALSRVRAISRSTTVDRVMPRLVFPLNAWHRQHYRDAHGTAQHTRVELNKRQTWRLPAQTALQHPGTAKNTATEAGQVTAGHH